MSPAVVEKNFDDQTRTTDSAMEDVDVDCSDRLTLLRSAPETPTECEVCVVGAGPAGLMLAANLARFGVNVQVIDDRADQTSVGR